MMVYAGLLFVALPVLLSLTYPHYSWGPGRVAWNIAGLGPLLVGFALVALAAREHIRRLGGSRRLSSTPQYFMQTGPYRYTRNPMYLAAALIWLGWVMLFGSLYLLVGLFILFAGVSVVAIPFEERQMEASFGEAYLQYKKAVARWLGRSRTA